jgi:hypothetical protein
MLLAPCSDYGQQDTPACMAQHRFIHTAYTLRQTLCHSCAMFACSERCTPWNERSKGRALLRMRLPNAATVYRRTTSQRTGRIHVAYRCHMLLVECGCACDPLRGVRWRPCHSRGPMPVHSLTKVAAAREWWLRWWFNVMDGRACMCTPKHRSRDLSAVGRPARPRRR